MTVELLDTDSLTRDRDQMFAQAVRAYREGAKSRPDEAFEREHIRPQQDARYEADAWAEPISAYLAERRTVYLGDVARTGIGLETQRLGTADQRRISAILEMLDWTRGKKDGRGNVPWHAQKVRSTEHPQIE